MQGISGAGAFLKDTGGISIVFTLLNYAVRSRNGQNTDIIQPCLQEEADARMILHVNVVMNCAFKSVMIKTVDRCRCGPTTPPCKENLVAKLKLENNTFAVTTEVKQA